MTIYWSYMDQKTLKIPRDGSQRQAPSGPVPSERFVPVAPPGPPTVPSTVPTTPWLGPGRGEKNRWKDNYGKTWEKWWKKPGFIYIYITYTLYIYIHIYTHIYIYTQHTSINSCFNGKIHGQWWDMNLPDWVRLGKTDHEWRYHGDIMGYTTYRLFHTGFLKHPALMAIKASWHAAACWSRRPAAQISNLGPVKLSSILIKPKIWRSDSWGGLMGIHAVIDWMRLVLCMNSWYSWYMSHLVNIPNSTGCLSF